MFFVFVCGLVGWRVGCWVCFSFVLFVGGRGGCCFFVFVLFLFFVVFFFFFVFFFLFVVGGVPGVLLLIGC